MQLHSPLRGEVITEILTVHQTLLPPLLFHLMVFLVLLRSKEILLQSLVVVKVLLLYTPGTSKFGTVISTNSTSITYGLGSIDFQTTHNVDPTLNNFADNDVLTIFDLSQR